MLIIVILLKFKNKFNYKRSINPFNGSDGGQSQKTFYNVFVIQNFKSYCSSVKLDPDPL